MLGCACACARVRPEVQGVQRGEVRHGGCEVSRAGGTNRIHTAGTGRRGVTGGVAGGNGQNMKPDDEDRSHGC